MLEKFYPDDYVNSTYEIDFKALYQEGYRGLIFDIDNTLVVHGARADERAKKLFQQLKEIGFECCLLSNNKEPRVKMFHDELKDVVATYIFKAKKPSVRNYQEAMRRLNTNVSNTVFIGDQIFTDIYGAKRTGLRNILVKPIDPKEEIQIVLKRYLEKIVLLSYKRYKAKK